MTPTAKQFFILNCSLFIIHVPFTTRDTNHALPHTGNTIHGNSGLGTSIHPFHLYVRTRQYTSLGYQQLGHTRARSIPQTGKTNNGIRHGRDTLVYTILPKQTLRGVGHYLFYNRVSATGTAPLQTFSSHTDGNNHRGGMLHTRNSRDSPHLHDCYGHIIPTRRTICKRHLPLHTLIIHC